MSVSDVLEHSKTQTFISYLFPIFRYHDRDNLNKDDFDLSALFKRNDRMGYTEYWYVTRIDPRERPLVFDDKNHDPDFTVTGDHLKMIIDLCKVNNIDVVLIQIPSANEEKWSIIKHIELQSFADENDVILIDFNTGAPKDDISLDWATDFYDRGHVNINGATKISRYLAQFLSENYDLPDRRHEDHDPHWGLVMDVHNGLFSKFLDNLETLP